MSSSPWNLREHEGSKPGLYIYTHVHENNFHLVLVLRTVKQVVEGMVKEAVSIHYFIVFSNSSTIFIQTLLECKHIYSSPTGTSIAISFSFDVGMHFICKQ